MGSIISLKDRFEGCVLGGAIGDALGYEVEFTAQEFIRRRYGDAGIKRAQKHHLSSQGRPVHQFSDDTQMSIAVMRGLLRVGRRAMMGTAEKPQEPQSAWEDRCGEAVAHEFTRWVNNPPDGHRAPGGACMSGIHSLSRGYANWRSSGGSHAGGCGSVMRTHPYALFHYARAHGPVFCHEAMDQAVMHSRITHQDPIALAACAAHVAGLYSILEGDDPDVVAGTMYDAARAYDQKTANMLRWVASCYALTMKQGPVSQGTPQREMDDFVFDRMRGWAAHEAIAAALYTFLRFSDDFEKGIQFAATTPGDSDSLASIAGTMLGARNGMQGIPADLLCDIERGEQLQFLADALYDGRGLDGFPEYPLNTETTVGPTPDEPQAPPPTNLCICPVDGSDPACVSCAEDRARDEGQDEETAAIQALASHIHDEDEDDIRG